MRLLLVLLASLFASLSLACGWVGTLPPAPGTPHAWALCGFFGLSALFCVYGATLK